MSLLGGVSAFSGQACIDVQTEKFPAESPAAAKLEALHVLTTAADVCGQSTADLWHQQKAGQPLMRLVASRQAKELLNRDLELSQIKGPPQALQQFGLSLYHALDTLPTLYNKLRCVPRALVAHTLLGLQAPLGSMPGCRLTEHTCLVPPS